MRLELVEPERVDPAYRADISLRDTWLVCSETGIVCEIARQVKHGDAREVAARIAAALELVREVPTPILTECVRKRVRPTFVYPETPAANGATA